MPIIGPSALENRLQVFAKTDNAMFIPKALETVKYEGKTIQAYPIVGPDAPASERIYALLCNKHAAENAFLSPLQTISFYSSRCGMDAHARVFVAQWMSRFRHQWCNPAALEVLSYHDTTGAILNDAIDPVTRTLRPIDDGTIDTRRPANVRFVHVRCTLDYHDLHHTNSPCVVKLEYFIPLPIGNVTFLNTAGNPVNRYTCTIPGDPFSLTTAEFRDQVLVPSGVGGPCGLLPPALGSTECAIDDINKWQQLQYKIASAAHDSIYHNLREHLAPGFSATAFATCEKITMAFQDEDGNSVSLTVLEYYNALLQGAVTFLEDESFQYNLANHFVNNLERNVRDMFEESCTDHLSFCDLSRDAQLRQLQKYLLIATRCEKKLSQTKDFVKKTIGDTHSFMSKFMSAIGMDIPSDASDGSTFISAAEKTLQRYKDGRRHGHRELSPPTDECWGCKGPHRYRDKHTKEVICPNKDARGVAERAAKMHKEYLEAIRSRRKGWVPKDKVKFSQLSPSQKEAGRQYFLRQAQELSSGTSTTTSFHRSVHTTLL
jgi:hypothetical protein